MISVRAATAADLAASNIAITTKLRVHPRDRKFRILDHGLRVRMLIGWVHHS